jgi:hypothetical protein
MSVQMPLTHLPDLALKQVLDGVRVFKEYVRTERALNALGGSMFWKSVGEYEYLVQRTNRRLTYLGRRTTTTERQLDAFLKERERLRSRASSLTAAVDVAQRMNKAVRTGGVSTSHIEVMLRLEGSGLADRTLVLGPLALQAYAQSAGLAVESDPLPIPLLIDMPATEIRASLSRLETAMSHQAHLEHTSFDPAVGALVILRPVDLPTSKVTTQLRPELEEISPSLARQLRVLRAAPAFEQVLIARTGRMARARASDPAAFALVARTQGCPSAAIVDQMLRENMLISQWSTHQQELANQQLQGIEPVPGLAIA